MAGCADGPAKPDGRLRAAGGRTDERYQVADPSVLFEDVWAENDGAGPSCVDPAPACPTCGYEADLAEIRCPRCFTVLLTGCSGSCGSCGSRTCTGEARKR